jgi:hypothetical protein
MSEVTGDDDNTRNTVNKSQHFSGAHCVPGPILSMLYTFQLILKTILHPCFIDEKTEQVTQLVNHAVFL